MVGLPGRFPPEDDLDGRRASGRVPVGSGADPAIAHGRGHQPIPEPLSTERIA